MNTAKLAIKNILHRPLNLLLSLILFGLGIGLMNFLILLNTQLKEKFDKNLANVDLVIGAKGSPLQMILCSMYHIDNPTGNIKIEEAKAFLNPRHPLVKKAVPLSLGDSYRAYRIVGTTPEILELYDGQVEQGRFYTEDLEVTIGKAVADDSGLQIGDTFYSSHGFADDDDFAHENATFKVVGILAGTGSVLDQLILTNTSSIWLVHEHEEGVEAQHTINAHTNADLLEHLDQDITSIMIQYKSKTNFQALNLPRNINENTDMQAASPAIEINRLYSMIGAGTDTLRWLAILIAIVSAISIFITLFKSMKDRKYELALMRVLGSSRSKLFVLIILEGLVLAFLGFLVGFVLSHVGMEVVSKLLKSEFRYAFTGWRFLSAEWLLLGVSLALGLIAALIPALQASRTDINKTLQQ